MTDADLLAPTADQEPARQQPESLEVASLRHDVECTLIQLLRERTSGRVLLETTDDAKTLAATLAPLLSKRVGGRYVPKDDRSAKREYIKFRNAAVLAEFNGRNRDEVMVRWDISRRLFYNIIANKKRD